jgi:hypothetical protein
MTASGGTSQANVPMRGFVNTRFTRRMKRGKCIAAMPVCPADQGNAVNRSARSVAFAASPRSGPTPKISSTDRNVEL